MKQARVIRCKTVVHATATVIFVCATWMQAQIQTSQSADLQVLKDKLQRLEREMQGLKGEIEAMEQAQPNPLAAAAAALVSPPPTPT